MIKQETIIQVRDRASIVEVISDYVTLKKSGRNYMGLCPFHSEKSPSFTVNEEKGIFHCFGCQTGGSVFQFLMQYDRMTFPEAVERVARRYGIEIDYAQSAQAREAGSERERLYQVNQRVAAQYQKILLQAPQGAPARAYLEKRGVDQNAIERFSIGYAPRSGSGLVPWINKSPALRHDAIRLGLIGERSADQVYEKFFDRVIFPIVDASGKVVAFGGRVLDQGMPKYLNSTETPLFHKGSTLYGLYQAKDSIRKTDRVVVVEGYLDVVALNQHGIDYAVATLGTALTVDHLRRLVRYSRNIVALFDGDDAGRKAAARSFEIFVEAGLIGRAAFLPSGEDPDSYVRRHGKEAIEKIIGDAKPLADTYVNWLQDRFGRTLEGDRQVIGELTRVLVKLKNQTDVDMLLRRAIDVNGIREESLRTSIKIMPQTGALAAQGWVPTVRSSRDEVAERTLIRLMLDFTSVIEKVCEQPDSLECFGARWRPIVDGIVGEWHEHGEVDLGRLADRSASEFATELNALAIEDGELAEADSLRMAADCLVHLRRKYFRDKERFLRSAIRAAEESNDERAKRERILEWQDVVQKKRQLETRKQTSKIALQ